jgi:acetyl esterase
VRERGDARSLIAGLCLGLVAATSTSCESSTTLDVIMVSTFEYARRDGVPLMLDAYLPPTPGPHPAVLLIHGGGWEAGSRSDVAELGGVPGTAWARTGFAAFSVDYRLAPEHPYPAAVQDVRAAVAWIRRHADDFSVDPERIGAFGMSAGGHLAAMLAVMGEGSLVRGSRVRAVVSWSAPLHLGVTVRLSEFLRPIVARFLGCRVEECGDRLLTASATSHIDPSDAPILIVNSTDEFVPLDQATVTAEGFRRHGVPVRSIELPGSSHGGYASVAVPGATESVWEATVAFLRRWLGYPR